MFRFRTLAAAVAMASLGVVATPGTALASNSCTLTHGFRPTGRVPVLFQYYAREDCLGFVTHIALVVTLYRHVPGTEPVLVATGAASEPGTNWAEARTTPGAPCIPAEYSGRTDYTITWEPGVTTTNSVTYGPALWVCS